MPDTRDLTQTGGAPHRARPVRRAVLAAGGGGALSLALAACGAGSPGGEKEGAGAPAASQPVSLDLWHSYGTTQGGGLAMLDQLEEYRRRRPHVTVVNTADASREKFVAALAADTVPDLYKLSASEVIEFGEQNVLLPLDAMIKRDRWDLRQYFDFVVQHTSYKGQVLSITHHPDIRLMFWSKKVFRDAGQDEARPPQNWTETEVLAQRLLKRDGGQVARYGFVPTWTAGSWLLQYWQANGAKILSDDAKKVAFNVPAAAEAADWVVKIMENVNGGADAVAEWDRSQSVGDVRRGFARERLGMTFYGNWQLFFVGEENPSMPFGLQAFPGGPGAAGRSFVFGGGQMVGVTKASKKSEAAWEYLKFMGGKDGQYLVQKRTSDVAGHREAAYDPEILSKNLGRKEVLPLFERSNGLSYVPSPAGQRIESIIAATQTQLLKRELAPKDATAEAARLSQQALDEYWSQRGSSGR